MTSFTRASFWSAFNYLDEMTRLFDEKGLLDETIFDLKPEFSAFDSRFQASNTNGYEGFPDDKETTFFYLGKMLYLADADSGLGPIPLLGFAIRGESSDYTLPQLHDMGTFPEMDDIRDDIISQEGVLIGPVEVINDPRHRMAATVDFKRIQYSQGLNALETSLSFPNLVQYSVDSILERLDQDAIAEYKGAMRFQ